MSLLSLEQMLLLLLIWTRSYSWALDYFSFYEDLKLADQHVTHSMSAPSLCTCFAVCRAWLNCSAATYTPDSGENTCRMSNRSKTLKRNLEPAENAGLTSLIVGYQLFFADDKADYNGAKASCKNMGMRLASFSDMAAFNYVRKLFIRSGFSDSFWVDLTKINEVWVWGNGVVNSFDESQGPWSGGEPATWGSHAAMRFWGSFMLGVASATDPKHYICET